MIMALLLAAADSQPSPEFVAACHQRATNQAEIDFCVAGERELQVHRIQDAEEVACFDRDQSQQGMNRCAGDAYQRADKALNAEWAKVLAAFEDAEGKKLLLDGQRAWLKYRDAHCRAAAFENLGGSIWPLINSGCLTSLTRERTRELADLIDGTE
jgi:uncharacterized protein YecT (DUF1311 family)